MNRRGSGWSVASVVAALLAGCDDDNNRLLDAGPEDLGVVEMDVPAVDVGRPDAGSDVAVDRGVEAGTTDVTAVDAGNVDASDAATIDRPDVPTSALDAGTSDVVAPADAGPADAGAADAGAADVVTADASSARGTPVLDGIIGSDWPAGAIVATNTVASAWERNALRSIRVAWDSSRLYLGIDGTVEASNAMLVFIDRDYVAGATPTGVPMISTLTDGMGALDNSISCNVTSAPSGFGVDMVWGTRGMLSKTATEVRADVGLRDVGCAACRGDFRWTMGDAVVCVGGASPSCEVAIEWSALYGGAAPPVPSLGLFVRITNAEGNDLSNNQCLPEQSAGDPPTAARRVLTFSPNL